MYRSRRSQVFFKKMFLKISQYLQENTSLGVSFFCNFIQKKLQRCFPVNISEFLRIAIFIEHLWWLLQYRVITLKQVQVASSAFLRCSFRKIFLNFWIIGRRTSTAESDLSRIAPAALLLSLFVMDNFLEILQEFKENSFQYKK